VILAGIWLAALSIVSIQSIQTPLDLFSNTKSYTDPRSGNVLVYSHTTHRLLPQWSLNTEHFINNMTKRQCSYELYFTKK